MGFSQQAHGQRQPCFLGKLSTGISESVEVIADFFKVGGGRGLVLCFEGHQVDESRLRSFDLGGENRFLPNEGVDEPVDRRDHLAGEFQPRQGLFGEPKPICEFSLDRHGRIRRRERRRDVG